MTRLVHDHAAREPATRLGRDLSVAVFFPGEVARILGLDGIEYGQLRRLFVLARVLRGEPHPDRGWSRFTLADLAAVEVLVGLGGGRECLHRGRHLVLGDVETACQALRRLGVDNPLLQVPMARDGRRILARVGEYVIEPVTGQLALADSGDRIDAFLRDRLIQDRAIRAAITAERRRLWPPRRVLLAVHDARGTIDVAESI